MKRYIKSSSYYDDLQEFMDSNFETIANLCKKCGYYAYGDYKKGDSGYHFDVDEAPRANADADKLDTALTRFFRKNGYKITMYPKNRPALGGFRVVVSN